ncbi:MAG: hypothetical protein ACR2NW_05700 [Thermodesulfobacteriota bacterium]
MDPLTREELLFLINRNSELSVSLYIPTYTRGTDTLQNEIRFKNLLKQLKEKYKNDKTVNLEINNLLKNTGKFSDNYTFWQHQSDCLAIFLSEDFIKYYRLPIKFDEFTYVGKNFYILPLISYLNLNIDFYILYLSQKEISLFSGENFELKNVSIEKLSDVVDEELKNRDFQKQLQFYTGAGAGKRKDSMFYGTGAKDFQINKYLLNFFHKIDRSIRKSLIGKRPLILAGADYIFPIYREANSYPWIMEGVINGNPKDLKKNELVCKAGDILKTYRKKEMEDEYNKLIELKNTDQSRYSCDLDVVMKASYHGKIDELFITAHKEIWGIYNEKKNKIELHDKPGSESDELLNIAATNTLNNGGEVYMMDFENKKLDKPVAARFRY